MKKMTYVFTTLLILSILTSCQNKEVSTQSNAQKVIKVKTQKVVLKEEPLNYHYSGQIESSKLTKLSFSIPGKVTRIFVEEGDQVEARQVLAIIDDANLKSAYKAAKATHQQTEDAYERLKKVYDNGSLPEIDWQDIKAKMAQTKAALEIAEKNLNNCQLLSPSSGMIGKRNIEVGMNASPNLPVFDLLEMDPLYVRISVPENEITKIEKGWEAQIKISALGEEYYTAKIEKIGVSANTISRTYQVKLLLLDTKPSIRPGMLCDVQIQSPQKESLISIPYEALLTDESENYYVFTFDFNNEKLKKSPVEIGRFINNEILIKSGLNANDFVVISGQQKITENTKVTI